MSSGLLYVVSSGRSGSTALELLLATHPAVRTLGELQALPHVIDSPTARCGCGEAMVDCPLWRSVAADGVVDRATVPLHLVREAPGVGRVLRWRWLPEVLRTARGGMARRYADGSVATTNDVRRALERLDGPAPEWWVDSSKDVYRLHLLAAGLLRPLRAVLLVRDPRAFVHASAGRSVRRTLRMALRWDAQQVLGMRVVRWLPADARATVRYEDLTAAPDKALAALAAILGIAPSDFAPDAFRERPQHAVAGNRMRFGEGPLVLDERWRRESPLWQRFAVWVLCAPVARRFGYGWSGAR